MGSYRYWREPINFTKRPYRRIAAKFAEFRTISIGTGRLAANKGQAKYYQQGKRDFLENSVFHNTNSSKEPRVDLVPSTPAQEDSVIIPISQENL